MKPDKQKNQGLSIACRPEEKFLVIYLLVIVSIPVGTTVIFYYWLSQAYLEPKPEEFQNIKSILVKYGTISSNQSDNFTFKKISNTYFTEAKDLAQHDFPIPYHWPKLIFPIGVVLGIFIWATLCYRIPGVSKSTDPQVSKSTDPHIRDEQEKYLDNISDGTMGRLNHYNGVIISVNGFIISILGGFLVTYGSKNFYFFLGFETIVFSLICSLIAAGVSINFSFNYKIPAKDKIPREIKVEETSNEMRLYKPLIPQYFRLATLASTSLILGLMFLVTSFA